MNSDRGTGETVLGRPREFWTARSTAIGVGATLGALTGVLNAALMLWAVSADHWMRDSWLLVGAGYAVVMAVFFILMSLFIWWISYGIPRKY